MTTSYLIASNVRFPRKWTATIGKPRTAGTDPHLPVDHLWSGRSTSGFRRAPPAARRSARRCSVAHASEERRQVWLVSATSGRC